MKHAFYSKVKVHSYRQSNPFDWLSHKQLNSWMGHVSTVSFRTEDTACTHFLRAEPGKVRWGRPMRITKGFLLVGAGSPRPPPCPMSPDTRTRTVGWFCTYICPLILTYQPLCLNGDHVVRVWFRRCHQNGSGLLRKLFYDICLWGGMCVPCL